MDLQYLFMRENDDEKYYQFLNVKYVFCHTVSEYNSI